MNTISSWKTHNISPSVGKYAENLGLECISTGGCFDFVFRKFDCGAEATLTNECGKSPGSLDERCSVLVQLGEGARPVPWMEIRFKDAKQAMKWMKKTNMCAMGTTG